VGHRRRVTGAARESLLDEAGFSCFEAAFDRPDQSIEAECLGSSRSDIGRDGIRRSLQAVGRVRRRMDIRCGSELLIFVRPTRTDNCGLTLSFVVSPSEKSRRGSMDRCLDCFRLSAASDWEFGPDRRRKLPPTDRL
jgi:hypothetical protein